MHEQTEWQLRGGYQILLFRLRPCDAPAFAIALARRHLPPLAQQTILEIAKRQCLY
jgi:hypothetical protein